MTLVYWAAFGWPVALTILAALAEGVARLLDWMSQK